MKASDAPWQSVDSWRPIDIPAAKLDASVPEKLAAVVAQLDVDGAPRYARNHQGAGETYCNIFVWDVTRAMGCEVPHWVLPDGSPGPVNPKRASELNANGVVRWLLKTGPSRGWILADKATATAAAARGHVVVVGWDAGNGRTGHVAIMLPDGKLAQAGAKNGVGLTVAQSFGRRAVQYFIQSSHRSQP